MFLTDGGLSEVALAHDPSLLWEGTPEMPWDLAALLCRGRALCESLSGKKQQVQHSGEELKVCLWLSWHS